MSVPGYKLGIRTAVRYVLHLNVFGVGTVAFMNAGPPRDGCYLLFKGERTWFSEIVLI
jgi:hypothetical protein